MQALREAEGPFDLIFNDIDKAGYPASIPVIKEKLKPGGVLSITRWMWKPERETIRVVSLARDALRSMGAADPSRHIVVPA